MYTVILSTCVPQTFTKSKDWFDTSKGWKSTQGGFSAIQQITTDKNNMGGFFVRKMAGAAAVAIHLQKMLPLLFHPLGAQWVGGHFRPLLWTALVGNVSIVSFYALYMSDLAAAGAASLPKGFMALLTMETLAIMVYLFTSRKTQRGPATAMKEGKTPSSPVSRIVARTVLLVSSAMVLIAGRDLFFPGFIFEFFPRDDIYLEWTNSFIHSPPEGSPEAADQGLEAPLYIGDKFMSQYLALHLLLLCLYKYVSSFIRLNADGSGEIRAKMIWKGQAIGDALLLFVMRLFTSAAVTASLNLRWHVMCLAYETFILGSKVHACQSTLAPPLDAHTLLLLVRSLWLLLSDYCVDWQEYLVTL